MNIKSLENKITKCRKCDRLVKFREKVASEKRKSYINWDYWGKPVPGYGSQTAKIMILGLAPAAHGGNRTGRVFTGDKSAEFLFKCLHHVGLSNQPNSDHRNDGLELKGYITSIVLPLPKGNKETVLPWLQKQGRKIYNAIKDFEPIAWNVNIEKEGYIVIETGIKELPQIISHKGPAPWEKGAIDFLEKYPNAILNNERLEVGKEPKKRTINDIVNELLPSCKIKEGLYCGAKAIQRVPWLD